jgi:hypothetical protein
MLRKVALLVARETRIFGLPDCNQEFGPIAVAANLHFITRPPAINPRMIALVAKIDKAIALAEERGTYEAASSWKTASRPLPP